MEKETPHNTNSLDGSKINLLCWNIHKSDDKGWEDDLRNFITDKHIVTLQEAVPSSLSSIFEESYHITFAEGYRTKKRTTGVLTASSIAVSRHETFTELEPLLRTPKAMNTTYCSLQDSSLSLLVINIHAVNFEWRHKAFERQLSQAGELIRHHKGPVIFCGDFNTWSEVREELLHSRTEELGLRAVEFINDHRTRFSWLFSRHVVDHIFVRDLHVHSASTSKVTSSDHNPLMACFSWTADKHHHK